MTLAINSGFEHHIGSKTYPSPSLAECLVPMVTEGTEGTHQDREGTATNNVRGTHLDSAPQHTRPASHLLVLPGPLRDTDLRDSSTRLGNKLVTRVTSNRLVTGCLDTDPL